MDAIKFVNEKVRMCNSVRKDNTCKGCRLHGFGGCDFDHLVGYNKVEEAVQIVEEWSKENLPKTRQSVFIKQHPQVVIYNGVVGIRPCQIVDGYTSDYCRCDESQCVQCRKEYWLQEVE